MICTDSYYLTNKMKEKCRVPVKQFLPIVSSQWLRGCQDIKIPQKIKNIAYFGSLDTHIDLEIFKVLIEKNYNIHFWGKLGIACDLKIINHGYCNDHQELAKEIIKEADAIIIPYKGNMDGVIPAKLMQAFATQLPVYVSCFYDSKVLQELLYIYNSSHELVNQIETYDKNTYKHKLVKIKEFIKNKDENTQYKEFCQMLIEHQICN